MSDAHPDLSAVEPDGPGRSDLSAAFGTSAAGSLRGLLSPRRPAVRSVDPVGTDAAPPEEDIVVQPSRKRPARDTTRTSGRRRTSPVRVRDRKDVDLLLLAVARDGVASGREFIEQVRRRSSGTLVLSERSVYHQLHRLRNERLIRDTGRGGARRFVLTPLGERVLASRVRGWETFAHGLDRVLASGDPAAEGGGDLDRDAGSPVFREQ